MKIPKNRYLWSRDYHACWICKRKATWHYSPSCNNWKPEERERCDECVPRGCSCQIDSDTRLPERDEKGRELPCCEWNFYPKGNPLVWHESPSRKNRPVGQTKWWFLREFVDRRRWRGELRRWLKDPKDCWWPHPKKRRRNDLVATRLLKQIYPMVQDRNLQPQRTT